jgi:hypothetical protein
MGQYGPEHKKMKVNNESTGAAPAMLTKVDEVIMDIIGSDSAALNGLGQDDDAPTFGARNHGDSLSLLDNSSGYDGA